MPGPPETAVLESYLAVIAEIAGCIGATCPDVASPHQEHLLRMRSRLAFASDERTLAETREAIENELRTYAERAHTLLHRRSGELRRILKALAQVTGVLAEHNQTASRQLADMSAQVQQIADQVPWLNVRDALREIVANAGSQTDVLRLDSQLAQAHIEEQIRALQSRLEARNPRHLDLLTGLGHRQAVEEQIARRLENGKPFALVLIQTSDLASLAPTVADHVLIQAASRLAGQVRAHDYVGRWGTWEFAIVMECSLENAEPRSQQIARWLSGTYVLRNAAAENLVEVTFTARVVDPSVTEPSPLPHEDAETEPLPA